MDSDRVVQHEERNAWASITQSDQLRVGGWLYTRHWLTVFIVALSARSFIAYEWPFSTASPRRLDLFMGIGLLIFAALVEVVDPFRHENLLFVALLIPLISLTLMTATRATLQGMALLSSSWTFLAVMGALYLSRTKFIILLVLQAVACTVAYWLSPLEGILVIALLTTFTATLVALIVFTLLEGQRRLTERLAKLATSDSLTGVLNRRGAQMEAEAVRSVAERSDLPTAVALIDIDEFKALNDRYGHDAGDAALIELTRQWQHRLRAGDVLGRMGGDEFIIVLPDTDEHSAAHLLDRLREGNPLPWSYGGATWHPHESLRHVLSQADLKLYEAKAARRSR